MQIQASVCLALKPCLPDHPFRIAVCLQALLAPAENEQALPLPIPSSQYATSCLSTHWYL